MSHRRSGIATMQVRDLLSTGSRPVIPQPRDRRSVCAAATPAATRREEQDRIERRKHRDRKAAVRELRSDLQEQMMRVTAEVRVSLPTLS